ncbi:hypothetical protein E4T43_08879 [Aureobasidium subglaciale]|nr:hypothetical protein E4T43_08879 [Aureobasidium subglaciale]
MGRKFVRYRGSSPTPYSETESEYESDQSQILIKKTVTKEKTDNWLYGRASQASSTHHVCPSPILIAVPINDYRKMEEVGGFTYEEWCKRRECVPVATETIAPKSSISNRTVHAQSQIASEVSDQDNAYLYVAMREPGPQDAVPVAYALYSQPGYTYMYPPQPFAAMAAPPAPAPKSAPKPVASVPASLSHSKQEEEHYRHYIRERMREKSVRAASEPPTIERIAPPPPGPQAGMATMTYGAYPFGMPAAAVPVAYAMPNYPVPVHAETASTASPKPPPKRVWVGRTKKQVDEDNAKIAHKEGVYKPNEMVPKAASPDQLFWVIEPDNSNTLRNFRTIEEDLQPGKWKVDPRYGNAYFVRDKKEKA